MRTRNRTPQSPVAELPVMVVRGVPFGGGSYQRLLPAKVTVEAVRRHPILPVLYYHSYDFGVPLPSPWASRSPAVLKQFVARGRIPAVVRQVLSEYGSISCAEAADGV